MARLRVRVTHPPTSATATTSTRARWGRWRRRVGLAMGAAGGIRTLKPLRAAGFEPALYAGSSTAACDEEQAHGSARRTVVRLTAG